MKKPGSIILGIGGDNSNGGIGTFFEGAAMLAGNSTDAADDAVAAAGRRRRRCGRRGLGCAMPSERMPGTRVSLRL